MRFSAANVLIRSSIGNTTGGNKASGDKEKK